MTSKAAKEGTPREMKERIRLGVRRCAPLARAGRRGRRRDAGVPRARLCSAATRTGRAGKAAGGGRGRRVFRLLSSGGKYKVWRTHKNAVACLSREQEEKLKGEARLRARVKDTPTGAGGAKGAKEEAAGKQ